MPSEIVESSLSYPSKDGSTTIRARLWEPPAAALPSSGSPRAIVQIVHGMCEHVGRYDAFARFLAEHGILACGEDHIGHGVSAQDAADLGHLPPREGKDVLVADVCALRRIMQRRCGEEVPYFLFGHSMGSFIVRAYLTRPCVRGLSGAILCGTAQQPRIASAAGNLLARAIGRLRGARYRSALIDGMGAGAYGKRIADARTPFDWLSTDPAVVDAYRADERCGFMFTVGGYAALTDLTGEIADPVRVARVPHDLPLLFVSGAQDPVGDNGKGAHAAAEALRRAGVDRVDEILYPGMRHEILNEPDGSQVRADILAWLDRVLVAPRALSKDGPARS